MIEQEGISDSAAGALAGVPSSTLARWKLEHEVFALELERARARFELAQIRAIRAARKRDGSPDWRAAAWLLKRSSPEGYGPLSRRRKLKTDDVQAEHGAAGDGHAAIGQAANRECAKGENCAILPETRSGHGASDEANGPGEADERGCTEPPTAQNEANLPETTGSRAGEQPLAGPRLSRRERRAEERRLAKANRVAG